MFTPALLAASIALIGAAQDQNQDPHHAPFNAAGTPFEMLTKLVGEWAMPDADRDGALDGAVSYRVTSNGYAVVETLFPGTQHEMITMYAFDGEQIVMTHYCAMGNQPRLVGEKKDDRTMHFRFLDGTNIDPETDMYMGELTLTVDGPDRLVHEWKSFAAGQDGGVARFEFTRVK